MIPATIVTGAPKVDFNNKIIPFGAYALAYTSTDNTNKARGIPAIALRASNEKGGHYFMNLYSGKKVHGMKWEMLPIDYDVIYQVNTISTNNQK